MRTAPRSVKEPYVFTRAYKKGKSVVTDYAVFYLLPRRRQNGLTLGITVSKKLGGAVRRNRVKRLVRESVRLVLRGKTTETDAALIVVARARAFAPKVKMNDLLFDVSSALKTLGVV